MNLMSNALKFTEKGSIVLTLDVESLSESKCCLVGRISDTGVGIPADQIVRLFTPFATVQREGKRFQGTGLGLMIVRKLLALMNGSISVESILGKGTTFIHHFTLDIPTASGPSQASLKLAELNQICAGMCVNWSVLVCSCAS